MKYLCRRLEELYPSQYRAIEVDVDICKPSNPNLLVRGFNFLFCPLKRYINACKLRNFGNKIELQDKDVVVLVEYMDTNIGFIHIAEAIHHRYPRIKVFGISHLVPCELDSRFNDSLLRRWSDSVDGIITLGSSLTDYYIRRGENRSKLLTTFHYVDDYYLCDTINHQVGFGVLVQGNQMRDMTMLQKIVAALPDVTFYICQGIADLSSMFNTSNVRLLPYMEESELRKLMYLTPVSLNVMRDTIGSNVIATSMGMGQAMICTDVGSIRNYCDDTNCIFCNTLQDYVDAICLLASNQSVLKSFREFSRNRAERLSIPRFHENMSLGLEQLSTVQTDKDI